MSLYEDFILDHYQNPRNRKVLLQKSAHVHVSNPLCGDELDVEVDIRDGKISDIGFSGQGCAISIASASILTEYIKGKSVSEVQSFTKDQALELIHIDLTANRVKCALLAWEAIRRVVHPGL